MRMGTYMANFDIHLPAPPVEQKHSKTNTLIQLGENTSATKHGGQLQVKKIDLSGEMKRKIRGEEGLLDKAII